MKKSFTVLIFFIVVTVSSAFSQTGIPKAQALFIYNFSRLIEWPANYKTGPFVIGSVGTSSTLDELTSYTTGKMVGSQPISVKKFDSPADISTCHILFVPYNKTRELPEIISQLQNKSTLIIAEKNGAIDDGAAINFVIIGNKLKFEIKPDNATKYNIKLSSKLSEMAYKAY